MIRYTRRILGGGLLALSVGGCKDFLTGEGISNDPNNPTEATVNQLFVAAQAALFAQQQGPVAQFSCLAVQHCGGVGNYVEDWANNYTSSATDFQADWLQVYVGGGLIDLRRIQEATATNNRVYAGMAKVVEAMQVSFAADNWGDIPYSDAVGESVAPTFDNQLDVYDALQTLLDGAIADLGSGVGSGPSPADVDLIYAGDADMWLRAAYTLKARIHMHTAEVRGASAYTAAIAAANLGINDVDEDFASSHTSSTSERNMWYQFSFSTFGQYLKAGSTLVNLMIARGEAERLPEYFADADPAVAGRQYAGVNVNGPTPPLVSDVATVGGDTRINDVFRQPMLSWEENQLILAEAKFQTLGAGAAQPHLDAVRAEHGLGSIPATLQAIAEEQYVEYFQNIEAWQSYKRTCWPNLDPSGTQARVAARLYYGSTEGATNENTPDEAEQNNRGGAGVGQPDAFPFRNRNDPPGGTVVAEPGCIGQ